MLPDTKSFSYANRSRIVAVSAMIVLVSAAVIAGWFTVDMGLFSLQPPATDVDPYPTADVEPEDAVVLYQTVYTAWATMLLLIPAFTNFWHSSQSDAAAERWKNFWTVSLVAFYIHLYWAFAIFFEGSVALSTSSSRVAAFWPGMFVAVWWGVDVVLAWTISRRHRWVRVQRLLLHLAVAAFFGVASIRDGEILTSKVLGIVMVLAVIWRPLKQLFQK